MSKFNALDLYFNELTNIECATHATNVQKAEEGDIDRLITANLRFVVRVASEYRGVGVPLADLIGAGNDGLVLAAKRFKPELGLKFTTYAVWWVRQRILNFINCHQRTVRIPVNRIKMIGNIKSVTPRLTQMLGRNPAEYEVAEAVGFSEGDVYDALDIERPEFQLDTEVHKGDVPGPNSKTWGDLVTANNPSPEEDALVHDREERIASALKCLDEREQRIVRLKYGFGSGEEMTLEEIGNVLNITKERVRQLLAGAIKKLRHPSRVQGLRALV